MKDKPDPQGLMIRSSEEDFNSWIAKPYLSKRLQTVLTEANVLIIPDEGYGDLSDARYFPSGTEEMFLLFSQHADEGLRAEICIEEEEYTELALHADIVMLAGIVASVIVVPVVINLVGEFLKRRIWGHESDALVRWNLLVVDEQNVRSVSISYDGPADKFDIAIKVALDHIIENGDIRPDFVSGVLPKPNSDTPGSDEDS